MKAFTVIRVSAEDQLRGYGPDVQWLDDIVPNAKLLGLEVDERLRRVIQEPATGWERSRFEAAVREAMALHAAGEIQALVFPRVDRETRFLFGSFPLLCEVVKSGLRVYFGREKFRLDPADPDSVSRYLAKAMEAASYIQTMRENTLRGRRRRASLGHKLPTGDSKGLLGYSYNRASGIRQKDPVTNSILRRAGELVMSRVTLRATAKILMQEFGRRVPVNTLSRVLRSPAISGRTLSTWKGPDGKETSFEIPDATPATFTVEEFETIESVLEKNKSWAGKQRQHYYPLAGGSGKSGMVTCAICGMRFNGACRGGKKNKTKDGRDAIGYRLYRHYADPTLACSNTYKYWPAHKLEEAVWRKVVAYFEDPQEAMRRVAEAMGSGGVTEMLQLELRHLEEQASAYLEEKSRLSLAWAKGRLAAEDYERRIAEIAAEEEAIQKRTCATRERLKDNLEPDAQQLSQIAELLAAGRRQFAEDSEPVIGLVSRTNDRRLSIAIERDGSYWVNPDPDQPAGRQAWMLRERAIRALGVEIRLDGRNMEVRARVPAQSSASSVPVLDRLRMSAVF